MRVLSLFVLLLFSCAEAPSPILQLGNWGAEHARLLIQAESWYLEFDCAHATVNEPVILEDGKFEKEAEYYQEAGYYIENIEPIAAKVTGELHKNGNLELIMLVGPDLEEYGRYTFIWNEEALLYKCA